MYNYRLTAISVLPLGLFFFLCGALAGGAGGVLLGLMDRSTTGLFGGLFLGFMFGLFSGLCGLAYGVIFNIFSPLLGGLPVRLESPPSLQPAAPDTETPTPE